MLPFLKKTIKPTGIAIEVRKPDQEPQDSGDMAMESVAKDLLDAIEMKDHKKLAMAIRNAFEIMDEPSEQESEMVQE